jgi:hypothetical protein
MGPLFSLASTITAIPRWHSCSGCIPGRPEPLGQPEADQGADGTRLPSAGDVENRLGFYVGQIGD